MKIKKNSFRRTEISKACAIACTMGFFALSANLAHAANFNLDGQPITAPGASVTYAVNTDSSRVYFDDNTTSRGAWVYGINLSLNPGVSLTGQTGLGAVPLAIYTDTTANGFGESVSFLGNNSTLTLNGNNQITGIVGARFDGSSTDGSSLVIADSLTTITVYNSSNFFNNQVHAANINLMSGSTVQFLGDIGGALGTSGGTSGNAGTTPVTTISSLNYLGSDSQVTIGNGVTVNGNVTNTGVSNSMLVFNGNGTVHGNIGSGSIVGSGDALTGTGLTGIGIVQVKGVNSTDPAITSVVTVNGNLSTDHLQYQANTRVVINGDLYLNAKTSSDAINKVAFGNTNGSLEIGNDGDIFGRVISTTPQDTITTTQSGTGILTMVSGAQSITGNVGTNSLAIGTLNIGGVGNLSSNTRVRGNVFASTVSINNGTSVDSHLRMDVGHNITGTIVTDTNLMGDLTLMGGNQTVTGTVGSSSTGILDTVTSGAAGATSTFTGPVFAETVTNSGSGRSNFNSTVNADVVNVNTGVSVFTGNLTAGYTQITSGQAHFSASDIGVGSGATATTDIRFAEPTSTTGAANLHNGLVGGISFAGNNGTVYLWNDNVTPNSISGSISAANTASTLIASSESEALVAGDKFRLVIDGQTYEYIVAESDNPNTVAAALRDIINNATSPLALVTASVSESTITFTADDAKLPFSITSSVIRNAGTSNGTAVTTHTGAGTINVRGGGLLMSQVGSSSAYIEALNINTADEQRLNPSNYQNLRVEGDVFAHTIRLQNSGTLEVKQGVNVSMDDMTTTAPGTGTLNLLGTSAVNGRVGSESAPLGLIMAGVSSTTDTFSNGIVYATNLNYQGDGTVIFNGSSANTETVTNGVLTAGSLDLGFVGTANFGSGGTGEFQLGNGVDLVTQHKTSPTAATQTTFVNANNATLRFNGSSVVDGELGSASLLASGFINTIGSDTFGKIYAGANSSVVTFLNNVYVDQDTFYISGTGTVNFVSNLYGSLRYDANGSVNVADGMSIYGPVTTTASGQGTLNFVGSTTTRADIGAVGTRLLAVNFHANSSDSTALPVIASNSTVNIGHNVYANTTTIGTTQNSDANATIANITSGVYLGNVLTLASSNVTLNTAGTVVNTDAISPVNFAHTKNADGTLTNTATVTRSTTGTDAITTNGATLNFAIGTSAWASNAGGVINPNASSSITGDLTSGSPLSHLIMNGNERVNLSLLGSMHNGQTHTLINVEGGVNTTDNDQLPNVANVKDNSYVINTTLSRVAGESGDLVVTFNRDVNVYRDATGTHFSNPAAIRLGTLAYNGATYGSDMQTALNMLDIDQWGYGNNEANLAVQAKRLAPIANNSIGLSMFRTTAMVSDNIGQRMHEMRISEQAKPYDDKGFWIRSMYQQGKQNALGAYDGFDSKISGFTMGIDARPNRESILGAALSYSNTKVEQRDFRAGDQATANAWHLSLYGAYDFTPELFVDGTLTASTASLDSARTTAVGRTAKADTDVNQLTGKINLGYRFKLPNSAASITPMLSYESGSMKQDAYSETGAGDIGLSTPSQRFNWNRAGVGLRLATTTMWGGMVAKPELTVMAQNENGNFAKPISSQYIGDYTNTAFTTEVADKSVYGRSSVRGTLGLNLLMSKSSSLSVRYDHTNGDDFKSNAFDLMARWKF